MLNFFNREQNSYVTALLSGYVLMGAHMLTQIVLTPLYLKTLGEEQRTVKDISEIMLENLEA